MSDGAEHGWPPDMDSAIVEGGPADPAVRSVVLDGEGQPPAMVMWRADGIDIGASDLPAGCTGMWGRLAGSAG